jgi:cilia- and flagella-associated protein 52
MVASMKDHRGPVNSIMVAPRTGAEAISASSDGACLIWDLEALKRRASFMSNTFFKAVAYHPDESQARSLR